MHNSKGWTIFTKEPEGKLRTVPPRPEHGSWWLMVDDNDEIFGYINPKGIQHGPEHI